VRLGSGMPTGGPPGSTATSASPKCPPPTCIPSPWRSPTRRS